MTYSIIEKQQITGLKPQNLFLSGINPLSHYFEIYSNIVLTLSKINIKRSLLILTGLSILLVSCEKDKNEKHEPGYLQLVSTKIGEITLSSDQLTTNVPVDQNIIIRFSNIPDTNTVSSGISLVRESETPVDFDISYSEDHTSIILAPDSNLLFKTNHTLKLSDGLKGINGETFPGIDYDFVTVQGTMVINTITLNNLDFSVPSSPKDIDIEKIIIEIGFSEALDPENYKSFFILSGNTDINTTLSDENKKVTILNNNYLEAYKRYYFTVSSNLTSKDGYIFEGFSNSFYTALDSTPKFPEISDEELLNLIQEQTFRYFYDFAHPDCGLARERNTSGDVVTIGGSGFGVMALIVGIERGFISRSDGLTRLDQILSFLETADRWHGAWPHWLNGSTGKVVPFSPKDDGGDLVETSFMIQGLLTIRQYLNPAENQEKLLINRINTICDSVEWDWFTRGEDVLYWHWSPNTGWEVNLKIQGYNETLITYVLAASSTTHPVSAETFHKGYMQNGSIVNGKSYYGYILPLGPAYGGPLFFTHYSFLGLDPRNLADSYANHWQQNVNHTLINRAWCADNPKDYVGYSEDCWGLTASDNQSGYSAHSPTNDLGVITPTAAISSLPYTPDESMDAIHHFYYLLGDKLWGEYGFYDAFNVTAGWWASSYISIDQGPIIVMIENYRTGLLWDLFMSCPEVQAGLDKLGFTY